MGMAASLAFVSPRFAAGGTVGGAETLLRILAERTARAGRRVVFLTTCATDHFTWQNVVPPDCRNHAGLFDVHSFPVNENRNAAEFARLQQAISLRRTLTPEEERAWLDNDVNSAALCRHLRDHGAEYDRVITGPYLFGLVHHAALIDPRRTLLVPCLHDEPFAYLSCMRTLFNSVAGCLFNSEPERDLAQRLYRLDPARGMVVGMGFDPFDADPAVFAARRAITAPYVIYSGRRECGKGTPLLTDYMHTFRARTGRDIKLVFTGSGPIEAPAALWPHIIDVGFVTETEKHEAMAGALAFIQPSLLESLGIVLLESFMARTPALVHADSAVLRWQCERSGAGLWFRTYPEFEESLVMLAEQPGLRRAIGERGRAFVLREYAWPAVENRLFLSLDSR